MWARWKTTALIGAVASLLTIGASPAAAGSTDTTAPVIDSITSTDYPAQGDSRLHQGLPGQFTLTLHDDGGGLRRVDWQLNQALAVSGAPPKTDHSGSLALAFVPTATPSVTVTPYEWGTNVLYVRALDRAGNGSQTSTYVFYVPYVAPPVAQGDLTGDGLRDLALVDTEGNLRVAPGDGQGSFGRPYVVAPAAAAPSQNGFAGAVIAHRGSTLGGPDDLIVVQGGAAGLYLNEGGHFATGGDISTISHVPCSCEGYPDDWSSLTSIAALGHASDPGTWSTVVTIENGLAWTYQQRGRLIVQARPLPLGQVDLAHSDLVAPGDVTGDGIEDLWVRDRASGSLTLFRGTEKDGVRGVDTVPVVIAAQGFSAATYPVVTSVGDLNGDGVSDLVTMTGAGALQRRSSDHLRTPARISGVAFGKHSTTIEDQQFAIG